MTTAMQEQVAALAFTAFEGLPAALGPEWYRSARVAAMGRFNELGLPTIRDEDWRFTNIAPIRQTQFLLPTMHELKPADLEPFSFRGLECTQLVFVNGRYVPSLSRLSGLPDGVKVISLAEAFSEERSLLEKHLGRYADFETNPFTALNTALMEDGVFVHVPRHKVVEAPIHLLNVTVAENAILTSPRNLIIADTGADVTVVEDYVSLRDDIYLTNAITEIAVGDNAQVTHYLFERESPRAFNVSGLHVRQGRDSRFSSHSALFGGAIVRNNVHPVLDGENCHSLLNGLYVLQDDQIVDNHMRVEHAQPHGDSRQFYKGIMNDRSRGVFRGRIVVHPGAQKTDAKQSNQNLLLTDDAGANTDPQLEIYADDVKCTHGATIGQLSSEQIFYLMARGVPRETARAMLVYAFASESIERMQHEAIRNLLRSMLLTRLPQGEILELSL